jgi:aspartate 1-decarboxylase
MILTMLKAKIHRAVVTEANLNYTGSITIDISLMKAAGINEFEQVHVVDVDNGNRLITYVIAGPADSGTICLNGAAARLVLAGDKVIIMAYCQLDSTEVQKYNPKVVYVDSMNKITNIKNSEFHRQTI